MISTISPLDRVARAASTLLEERVRESRSDFNAFAEFVMKDSDGLPMRQAVIHRTWHQHIEWSWAHGKIPAILAPFAMGKTAQLTIGRVAFEVGRDLNIRTKIICQSDSKAMERVMGVSSLLSAIPYRLVFPHVREVPKESARLRRQIARWTQHAIFIERPGFSIDPTVQSAGVLSSGTGGRADLLVLDDCVDQRNSIDEPALRQKVIDNVDNVWMQRLEPHGRVVMVSTPWHLCLPDGELVLTQRGRIPIEQLAPSDRLRVGPGAWEPAKMITRRWYEGDLVEIKLSGQGHVYRFTPEHRLPTGYGREVEAGELRVNERVLLDVRAIPEMSEAELSRYEAPLPTRRTSQPEARVRDRACKLTREQLQADMDAGLTYSEIARKHGYASGKKMIAWLVKRYGIPRPITEQVAMPGWILKPRFWRFVGYWIAEGHHERGNNATRMIFGYSEEEREFAEDAANCVRETLGVPVHVYERDHGIVVQFNCKRVGEWLYSTFGELSAGRMLPFWIEQLPESLLREMIYGYWIGDGSGGHVGTRFTTVSRNLAYDLARVLATRFGFVPNVYEYPPSREGYGRRHEVRVSKQSGVQLGLPVEAPAFARAPYLLENKDGRFLFPIRSIRRVHYAGYVTDVATSTGYFDLCGLTSHNSDLTHVILERPAWCVLRQWISEDFKRIEQEVYNADDSYPFPRAASPQVVLEGGKVESSNILSYAYQPQARVLEVIFRDGSRYAYEAVPPDVFAAFKVASSKGRFLHQTIKPRFECRRVEPPFAGVRGEGGKGGMGRPVVTGI